jgi:putative membrane protein
MKGRSWRQEGQEPDYRFSLANERTFLAWIRTALALLAAGVLLDQFVDRLASPVAGKALAVGLCALAGVKCIAAYLRWRGNEIAMRHAKGLPSTHQLLVLAAAMALVAGVLFFVLLVG